MAINVISNPETVINGNTNTKSRWLSVFRPINFTFEVYLSTFTNITFNDATHAFINQTGIGAKFADQTPPFQLQIKGSDFPDGEYTVPVGGVTPNYIRIEHSHGYVSGDYPFTGGKVYVQRENYYLKIKVKVAVVEVGVLRVKQAAFDDNISADVSGYLRGALPLLDTYNYTTLNVGDTNLSNYFQIEVSENWNGSEGSYDTSFTDKFYFTWAVNQLGSIYDGNLGVFVPFTNYAGNETRAKFLSDFDSPTYFVGYPFSLDFIFNDDLDTATYAILKKEQKFNINRVSQSTSTNQLAKTSSEKGKINRMKLTESYTGIRTIDVWLEKASIG
ncbi:MAG TPA: hypothetical protein PK833_06805 [Vicingus sp.]|nr:hypothetical protein [Vicingus sp.]